MKQVKTTERGREASQYSEVYRLKTVVFSKISTAMVSDQYWTCERKLNYYGSLMHLVAHCI